MPRAAANKGRAAFTTRNYDIGGQEEGMAKLLTMVGVTLGIAALTVVTSPAGSALIAGLTMTGID